MNFGTKLRTILAIATSLNTALIATDITEFNNATLDLIYKVASIVLNFIIVACVTYYNNDYTPVAAEYTGQMRQHKAELKNDYEGEYFLDDEEVDEEIEEENTEEETK